MTWRDRLRAFLGRKDAKDFAKTAPLIDGVGLQPQAPYASAPPKTVAIVSSEDALRGRISYRAGPSHTRYSTYIATGLSPATVYAVLKDADIGIMYRWADLVEQTLERDGHLRAVDRGRRVEVSGKPFRIQAVSNTPTAQTLASFMRAVVDQIDSFDRFAYSALSANSAGYSLSEIVYADFKIRFPDANGSPVTLGGLFPRQIDWVHAKHVRFDRDTDRPMLDVGNGGITDLPPHKFVFHPASGDGLYERRGHMRSCVWLHLIKQQAVRDWAIFSSLFAIPNIIAKYPRGISEPSEARTMYEQLLSDYGQGKPIIVPDDVDVSLTAGPTGTGNSASQSLIGWCDTSISKAVQGETLTTELSQTGSYNIGDVHADTKHAIIKDDARGLAGDIRSDLFRSVVELNLDELCRITGDAPEAVMSSIPVCSWRIEREVSPQQRADIMVKLANAGLSVSVTQIREEFGLDAPAEGAETLRGEPTPVPSGAKVVGATEASDGIDNPAVEKPAAPAAKPKKPATKSRRVRKPKR